VASLGGGFWCVGSDGSLVCVLGGVFGVVCVLGGVFGVVHELGQWCCARFGGVYSGWSSWSSGPASGRATLSSRAFTCFR